MSSSSNGAAEKTPIEPIAPGCMLSLFSLLDTLVADESKFEASHADLADGFRAAGITTMELLNEHKAEKELLINRLVLKRSAALPHLKPRSHRKFFTELVKKTFVTLKPLPEPMTPRGFSVIVSKKVVHTSTLAEIISAAGWAIAALPEDTPMSVQLCFPEPAAFSEFSALFRSLPSTQTGVFTSAHAWGEFSSGSMFKLWYVLSRLVKFTPDDVVADWGAGAGAQLIAAYYFINVFFPWLPQSTPLLGIEVDSAAYSALRENIYNRFIPLVENSPKPPRVTLLACDSCNVSTLGAATCSIQYDGAAKKWKDVEEYFKIIYRMVFTSPKIRVVVSTKMNKKTFRHLFDGQHGPRVFVGAWRHYMLTGLSQGGSNYQVNIYIRNNQEQLPVHCREKVEPYVDGRETLTFEQAVAASAAARAAEAEVVAAAAAAETADPSKIEFCQKPGCPDRKKFPHFHTGRPPAPLKREVENKQFEEFAGREDSKRPKCSPGEVLVAQRMVAAVSSGPGKVAAAFKASVPAADFEALCREFAALAGSSEAAAVDLLDGDGDDLLDDDGDDSLDSGIGDFSDGDDFIEGA